MNSSFRFFSPLVCHVISAREINLAALCQTEQETIIEEIKQKIQKLHKKGRIPKDWRSSTQFSTLGKPELLGLFPRR